MSSVVFHEDARPSIVDLLDDMGYDIDDSGYLIDTATDERVRDRNGDTIRMAEVGSIRRTDTGTEFTDRSFVSMFRVFKDRIKQTFPSR